MKKMGRLKANVIEREVIGFRVHSIGNSSSYFAKTSKDGSCRRDRMAIAKAKKLSRTVIFGRTIVEPIKKEAYEK